MHSLLLAIILTIFSVNCVFANFVEDDYLKCIKYFDQYENKYKIPQKLLYSIALVESGRYSVKYQKSLPWPWAVNQAGKSYYPKSKKEAMNLVSELIVIGKTNIDVGCMQINLHYHGHNFDHLENIFNPQYNVEFAAEILSNNYKKYKNWPSAVSAYHSSSDVGKNYYKKILKIWQLQVNNRVDNSSSKLQNKANLFINNSQNKFFKSPERIRSNLVVK